MRIANKERYAIKIMADLAFQQQGEYISINDISARQGISIPSLRGVVRALVDAGLIETDSAHLYHYRLKYPADQIFIRDIMKSTDGKFACSVCTEIEPEKCTRYRVCANVLFWEGMQESFFINAKSNQCLMDLVHHMQEEKQNP